MEVIIYLLFYHFHDCTLKEINYRRFDGLLAIPRKLIHLNIFSEVLFRAASFLQSMILPFNKLNIR